MAWDDEDDADETPGNAAPDTQRATTDPRVSGSSFGADDTIPGDPHHEMANTQAQQAEPGQAPFWGNAKRRRGPVTEAANPEGDGDNTGPGAYWGKDTADSAQWPPAGASPPPMRQGDSSVKNVQAGPGGAMVMRWLSGADAAPPQAVEQLKQQVDPDRTASEGAQNLLAIQHAFDTGGPDAALAVLQSQRVSYNAKQGFANAALNGADQKPPDVAAAAKAATQAANHIPDGTEAHFVPSQGGVTATVTAPGKPPQQFQLTLPQFNQYTKIGDVNGGQFDAIYENGGLAATLQKLSQGPGQPQSQMGGGSGLSPNAAVTEVNQKTAQLGLRGGRAQPVPSAGAGPAPGSASGPARVSDEVPGGNQNIGQPVKNAVDEGYDPALVARSHAIFRGPNQEAQRAKYLNDQTQQGVTNQQNQNKIDRPSGVQDLKNQGNLAVQGAKNEGLNQVAVTRAQAYTQHADIVAASKSAESANKMALEIYKVGQQSTDNRVKQQALILAKQVSASGMSGEPLSPEAVGNISRIMGMSTQGPQAPAATSPAAPSTQSPAGAAFKPPANWSFSASRGQYRDPQGNLYDRSGKPVTKQ